MIGFINFSRDYSRVLAGITGFFGVLFNGDLIGTSIGVGMELTTISSVVLGFLGKVKLVDR